MSTIVKIEDFFNASNHKLIIRDIFAMYHHRWDFLGESIQNAIDSALKKRENCSDGYSATVDITFDTRKQELIIRDNGMGISENDICKIAAPHVSLKNPLEANRGEFGVGLTFVAFSSNDFEIVSVHQGKESSLKIRNGYSWAMDTGGSDNVEITYDVKSDDTNETHTTLKVKPLRFHPYSLGHLEYVLRRHTAVGDFWSCFKKEQGPLKINLNYIDQTGKPLSKVIENKFWHPADYLSDIDVDTVDVTTVVKELAKGKDAAIPNWIGFGLTDKDTISEQGLEFTYYALFCRTRYYNQLAEKIGINTISNEDGIEDEDGEEVMQPQAPIETVNTGIFTSKKGMPLGAVVDHPRTAQAGYWRGMFIMMNCDSIRTEPGRKKLHVDDELAAKNVAKKIFNKMTKYSHYFIPRDPDEEMDSLLRNVDKNLQAVRKHRQENKLINSALQGINMYTEPMNEQTLIGLFHELIGAKQLLGYTALKLSATDTYDGVYEYKIPKEHVGKDHWEEWLRQFKAHERNELTTKGIYEIQEMIVEFKMGLQDVIKDFLQKTKYHTHIKLIVAWDADKEQIQRKGWLVEELPKGKQKFYGAKWRLRPSAEGQTRGIVATDVLLLKELIANGLIKG
ncbi:MAG TPA: ATP-binding protein [Acidobacteriota bacterium]|nr:ATP-binding protein [Acidobacteriota bacterium]